MLEKRMQYMIAILAIVVLGSYLFFKKTYLEFEMVYKMPESDYRVGIVQPYANDFFHRKAHLDSFFLEHKQTAPKDLTFDFYHYSYCVVYGKKVKRMFYSTKTKYFDNPSVSWAGCRKYRTKCVFVIYDKSQANYGTYIYRVKKDDKLAFIFRDG